MEQSQSGDLIQDGLRIAQAFGRELEPDQRARRMTYQLVVSARQWRESGHRWNPADALERAGLTDHVGERWIDARALGYLAELTRQLGPLATTPAALYWAARIGVEPWLVLGLLRREGISLPGAAGLRVPWEVIRRINRWSLALCVLAFALCETAKECEEPSDAERVRLDWPLLWNLRHLVPHPLALDPETARSFVEACANCDPVVRASDCLLEALWSEVRLLDSVRALVQRRPLSDPSLAGQPKQRTAALDEYPRDAWVEAVLTAAAYWLLHPERIADEMAELMAAEMSGETGEPLPPVFRLEPSNGAERWQRASEVLGPLLSNGYADAVRAALQVPENSVGGLLAGRWEQWARLVLFESVLREAYGAVSALLVDPLAAMERTRPRAERLLGPLDRPLGT
ncbi:hypothetical protein OO015_07720 [Thermomicrobium sp. 4228-Ro]|uniref:hypothetical protein n=1 Tax=Thermomicrobium sp. 4228-Ro TaxID=2993937 RepID=UPI002248DF5D|nr:hypothetical protein [Thermomicrobium sp. 4228-Ro]MCX2727385.1 hypothetical protein [Thermomicrobium sp. 4228-Ro]